MEDLLEDPSLLNESLDFFLRDFLGISGRPEPAASPDSFWRLEDLPLTSPESLDLLDCLDLSFFLGESAVPFSDVKWRLEDFGKSGRSLLGELGVLLPLFESTKQNLCHTLKCHILVSFSLVNLCRSS